MNINLSGVDYFVESRRVRKIIADMTGSRVTVKIDEENEATSFKSANGQLDCWIPWEYLPTTSATFLGHVMKHPSVMPYGCAL